MNIQSDTFFAIVEAELAEGRNVRMPLTGRSMEPTLRDGDLLTVAPAAGRTPAVGDIVLLRLPQLHLLHRVVAIEEGRIVTQGDNNFSPESAPIDSVVAYLVHASRLGSEGSPEWLAATHRALRRSRVRRLASRWLSRSGRRKLRPWYFAILAFLMWAPLNGIGVPLNNYILGLRADHLVHASVYLPCAAMLMDFFPRRRRHLAALCAVAVGLLTEGVQYLLPWRGFDVNDLIANAIGALLGWGLTLCALRVVRRRHQYPAPATRAACKSARGGSGSR